MEWTEENFIPKNADFVFGLWLDCRFWSLLILHGWYKQYNKYPNLRVFSFISKMLQWISFIFCMTIEVNTVQGLAAVLLSGSTSRLLVYSPSLRIKYLISSPSNLNLGVLPPWLKKFESCTSQMPRNASKLSRYVAIQW